MSLAISTSLSSLPSEVSSASCVTWSAGEICAGGSFMCICSDSVKKDTRLASSSVSLGISSESALYSFSEN